MIYRRFGKTESWISAFTLGTMRLAHLTQDQAEAVVWKALEAGINHLETAQAYGSSEVQLGQILKSIPTNDRPYLMTKILPTHPRDQLRPLLEDSLNRLQVDHIDHFAFHGINLPEHLDHALDRLPVIEQAISEGLVRHVGFSTHADRDLIQQTIQTEAFEFVNLHYYYFNQRHAPVLDLALEHDLGTLIISPADKGGQLYRPPQKLKDLCHPWTPLEFGYRFLLADDRIHTLTLGAETSAELTKALQSLDHPQQWHEWGSEILDRLQAVHIEALGSDRCAQCFECLPCPVSIQIPEVLRLRNLTVAYDMKAFGEYRYNMLGQAGHWFPGVKADQCNECGDCLPRCPEDLPIPQLLWDTHTRLNQNPIRRLWE